MQMSCNCRQSGSGTGGCDHASHLGSANPFHDTIDLACDETTQPLQLSLARGIVPQELIAEPYGTERQTNGVADVSAVRNGEFAASAAKVKHQRRSAVDSRIRDQSEVNQTRFFYAGDNLDAPSSCRSYPLEECLRITRISLGAGRNHSHAIGNDLLGSPMKPA